MLLITNDRVSYENLIALRNHNAIDKHFHGPGGFNFRMPEIQAGILIVKLKYLDKWIERRRKIAEIYDRNIREHVTKPQQSKNSTHSYHLYVIRTEKRVELCHHLDKRGIGYGVHYPIPCHIQYQIPIHLEFTELVARQVLSLPMFPELTDDEVIKVCEAVNGR
jgi:dTDP-4-amino-4,6-dideoxygalactose transaminase